MTKKAKPTRPSAAERTIPMFGAQTDTFRLVPTEAEAPEAPPPARAPRNLELFDLGPPTVPPERAQKAVSRALDRVDPLFERALKRVS